MIHMLALAVSLLTLVPLYCMNGEEQLVPVEEMRVTYNPLPLQYYALDAAAHTNNPLADLQVIPLSHFSKYVELLKKHKVLKKFKNKDAYYRQSHSVWIAEQVKDESFKELQKFINTPTTSLNRACCIYWLFPNCPLGAGTLIPRILKAVANREYLTDEMINMLGVAFFEKAVAELSERLQPLDELLVEYGASHPQKKSLGNGVIEQYLALLGTICLPDRLATSNWQTVKPAVEFLEETCHNALVRERKNILDLVRDKKKIMTFQADFCHFERTKGGIAALTHDRELLAMEQKGHIYICRLTKSDTEEQSTALYETQWMFSLCLPDIFKDHLREIRFSSDKEWLMVTNTKEDVIFFRIPLSYIRLSAPFEQLLWMILIHACGNATITDHRSVKVATELLNSEHIKNMKPCDRFYFISQIQLFQKQARLIRQKHMAEAGESFVEVLDTYFLPGEREMLQEDLPLIASLRLQKKLTKNMLAHLKEHYPDQKLPQLTVNEKTRRDDIKHNLKKTWETFLQLNAEELPEGIRKSFITLAQKSYDHYKEYQ